MRIDAEDLRPAQDEAPAGLAKRVLPPVLDPGDGELLDCLRGMGGWVSPEGLAPRGRFDRLVEAGLLEAWPGRPLYRARIEAGR